MHRQPILALVTEARNGVGRFIIGGWKDGKRKIYSVTTNSRSESDVDAVLIKPDNPENIEEFNKNML